MPRKNARLRGMTTGGIPFAIALLMAGALAAGQREAGQTTRRSFVPEATIRGTHAAFAARQITCVQLVQAYLDRIKAYDDAGPALNAIITINPRALDAAAEMDRLYAANRAALRPLHCIPVILKDNYDTADMPTTGGSLTLAKSVPLQDAFVVKTTAGRRGADPRESQPDGARARRHDCQLPGRPDEESIRSDPNARRLQRRHGRGDCRELRDHWHGQRHRPIDPIAGFGSKPRRPASDARARQPKWNHSGEHDTR